LITAAAEIHRFGWLVFTSTNAVDALWPLLPELPSGLQIAAVGRATAAALRERGTSATLTGTDDASSLLAGLLPRLSRGDAVLLPQAADARSTLHRNLEAAGATVTAVAAYDKALPPEAPERARELFAAHPLGWVTFTSPRIGRHFASLFGDDWQRRRGELRAASIGRVTSAELRALGVEPAAQAATPSNEELVAAVVRALS
jgi:uroporphyrinogen-III synthase